LKGKSAFRVIRYRPPIQVKKIRISAMKSETSFVKKRFT